MKVSSSKAKGRRLQYLVCEKLAKKFNIEFKQDDFCPIHSREMGQKGVDIIIRDEQMRKKFPFSVECKNTEFFSWNFIKQAKENKLKDTYWLLVLKRNREKPIVIMDFEDFLDFVFVCKEVKYE